jgi:hypothetical protein
MLSDGRVLLGNNVDGLFGPGQWWVMSPDPANGRYDTGGVTFTRVRNSLSGHFYSPLALTNSGDVAVLGQEFFSTSPGAGSGEIYRTSTNVWEVLTSGSSDDAGVVLFDGTILDCAKGGGTARILNPITQTWVTIAPPVLNLNESSCALTQDGSAVLVSCVAPPATVKYVAPVWVSAGNTTVNIIRTFNTEMGGMYLLPDGRLFASGGNGLNQYYTPDANPLNPGTWAAAPSNPNDDNGNIMQVNDCDGLLQPNGKVLYFAGPNGDLPPLGPGTVPTGTYTLELDPIGNTVTQVGDVPVPGGAANASSEAWHMIVLPTGEVMAFTVQSYQTFFAFWTPDGAPDPSWRPSLTRYPRILQPGQTYSVTGNLLNGIARTGSGGDEFWQNQLPLFRITHIASGAVRFGRSYGLSTMAVRDSGTTAKFTVPLDAPVGPSTLEVVVNGIACAAPLAVVVFPRQRVAVSGIGTDIDHSIPANVEIAELSIARGAITWTDDAPGPAITQVSTDAEVGKTLTLAPQDSTQERGGAAILAPPYSGGAAQGSPVYIQAGQAGPTSTLGGGTLTACSGHGGIGNAPGGLFTIASGFGGGAGGAGGTIKRAPGQSRALGSRGGTMQEVTANSAGDNLYGLIQVTGAAPQITFIGINAVRVSPSAGRSTIWGKNTSPSTMVVTEDDGTDITIGSSGTSWSAEYSTAGVFNVVVPAGVTLIKGWLRGGAGGGAGGGGGGGTRDIAFFRGAGGGAGGGSGANAKTESFPPIPVTPGDTLEITVGTGGAGGAAGAGGTGGAADTNGSPGSVGGSGGISKIVNLTTGKTLIQTTTVMFGGAVGSTALSGTNGGTGGALNNSVFRNQWGSARPSSAIATGNPVNGGNGGVAGGVDGQAGGPVANLAQSASPVPLLLFGGIYPGAVVSGNTGAAGGASSPAGGGGGGGGSGISSGTGDEQLNSTGDAPTATDGKGGAGGTGGNSNIAVPPTAGANGNAGTHGRGGGGGGGGGGGYCNGNGFPVPGNNGAAGGTGGRGSDGYAYIEAA